MPEEVNRLVTDRLASLLFTPSTDGDANLLGEGINSSQIHFVGNVMIDTLIRMLPHAQQIDLHTPEKYMLVTLHRPSNTDNLEMLHSILSTLAELSREIPVIFPIHPRTRKQISQIKFEPNAYKDLHLWDPVGYLEFLSLQQKSSLVITDSGGIQEETTFLQVPCLTVRENTERPITVTVGTNQLVGQDMQKLRKLALASIQGSAKKGNIPEKWDGHAGERIAEILGQYA
jgi:UDP-N-acetylglucosamine 2-epimerase (non-hydrolysing)